MNTIHLHGAMRKRFGGPFTLNVRTPAEAVHALGMQMPDFRRAVSAGSWRVVRGKLKGGRHLTARELGVNLPGEMHLVAAPQGAGGGNGGTGKIILGTLLVVAAIALTAGAAAPAAGALAAGAQGATALGAISGAGLGTSVGLGIGLSVSAAQIGMLGASLLFAGISQAISPAPNASSGVAQDTRSSFLFNGAINSAEQGVPYPVAFGLRVRTGGIIIASSTTAEDIVTATNTQDQAVIAAFVPEGEVQGGGGG